MSEATPLRRYCLRGLLVFAVSVGIWLVQPALAQDEAASEGEAELAAGSEEEGGDPASEEAEAEDETEAAVDLFSEDDLDTLVSPYALYPDTLLAQVFMASTFPLDIVKADRWVEENAELEESARAEAAEAEGWDTSVAVLAAGFPTVIDTMNDDLDSTEDLGNALLAQSDDVFDAVQRQRARAAAVGNLESNEAQVVEVEDDVITVAPADPEVVYVPTYDTQQVYTTPPPAQTVVVEDSSGSDAGALITTGLLSFGAGMLVNEIFDDNDPWDDYWRGPSRVDWNDGNFYPRPGVNVDGDVNIDVDRGNIDIDRDGAWRPTDERRDEARNKIKDRKGDGKLSGAKRDGSKLSGANTPNLKQRDGNRQKLDQKLKARSGDGKLGKSTSKRKAKTSTKSRKASSSALKGNRKAGLTGSKKASERGKLSKGKTQRKATATKRASKKRSVKKPSQTKRAKPQKSKRSSALKQNRGGGKKARQQKSRGSKSRKRSGKRR